MYRYRTNGVSVIAVIDRRRMKINGLFPVKIEVIYNRKQKYYPTSLDVSLEEWAKFKNMRRRPDKCLKIEKCFYLIQKTVDCLAENGEFSFRKLELRLGRTEVTVNETFSSKMKSLMGAGKINTYYRYRTTLRAVERFAGNNISFESITSNWLRRCESFWSDEGKNNTTVNIYMKTLKSVFNEAVENGIVRDEMNPFGRYGYKIPASSTRKLALTKGQLESIRCWKGDRQVEYWRDLWMFSYLCNGINFRDMLFLKYGNIENGEITFIRSKTAHAFGGSRVIRASLTPQMVEIMERSGNGAEGENEKYIFRHARGTETPLEVSLLVRKVIASCNGAMKTLADDLGIPKFSTYAARHSFATVLKKSGIDISYISECLGHASVTMTQNYLSGTDREERRIFAQRLI